MNNGGYFTSRAEVGQKFAIELLHLRYENTAILALSPGAVIIAMEIAKQLHSVAGLLLLKDVYIPGEGEALGMINDKGGFTYNKSISAAQIEEFETEYRGAIDAGKMNAMHELHVVGQKNMMSPQYCRGRTVIVVDDFSMTGTAFQAAADFLKPVPLNSVIMATAVAQEKAVDVMHRLADKLLIAHTTDKDFPPEHYFANNEIPQSKELIQMMEQVILQW